MNGTAVDAEQRRRAAEPALEILLGLLTEWSGAHHVALVDRAEACEIVWGTMYGMASIGRLDTVGNERAQRLAADALGATLRGWRSEGPSAGS